MEGQKVDLTDYLQYTDIVDNLSSTATNKPLSANQGRVLDGKIDECAKNSDFITLTQAEYDALETKENIYYFIKEEVQW